MDKQITLDDFSAQLQVMTARFAAAKVVEDLSRKNHLLEMLMMGYKPPTKWQRFKYRLADLRQRAKDIWTILSGGDIHSNCGY
jgi:hypothetical protein